MSKRQHKELEKNGDEREIDMCFKIFDGDYTKLCLENEIAETTKTKDYNIELEKPVYCHSEQYEKYKYCFYKIYNNL